MIWQRTRFCKIYHGTKRAACPRAFVGDLRKGRAIPHIDGHSPKTVAGGGRRCDGLRGLTFVRIRIILIMARRFVLLCRAEV